MGFKSSTEGLGQKQTQSKDSSYQNEMTGPSILDNDHNKPQLKGEQSKNKEEKEYEKYPFTMKGQRKLSELEVEKKKQIEDIKVESQTEARKSRTLETKTKMIESTDNDNDHDKKELSDRKSLMQESQQEKSVFVWMSHKPPSSYPVFPYYGLVNITRRPGSFLPTPHQYLS